MPTTRDETDLEARAALDVMSSEIIEEWLSKQPVLLPEHKRFLEQALRSYEEFAAETGQEEESRAGVAQAYSRVGFIRDRLGQRGEALAAWERTRELHARLVADFPAVPAHRQGLARSHRNLAVVYAETSRGREAESAYGEALTHFRNLVAEFPDVPAYRNDLGRTLNNLGVLLRKLGRAREAEEVYGEAAAVLKQLAAGFPTEPGFREELAHTYMNLGVLLHRSPGRSREAALDSSDRSPEAAAAFAQAVAIQKLLADLETTSHVKPVITGSRKN
jgi:tetratricopeptide (TPR) repeat protein